MEAALIIMPLMVLFALLGLGVFVTVKAVTAAKRGVDRTLHHARRTVEDTTLRARSLGQVGVSGSLAQLRLDLRMSMRATQEALYTGLQQDSSLSESIALFERLNHHGHELDEELRRLEGDPDKDRISERLPELAKRTKQITGSADSLRWAVRDRARRFAEDDLSALSAQIEVESGALRDWSKDPGGGVSWADLDTPEGPAPAGPAAPEENAGPAVPRSIEGSGEGPALGGYSWQKTPRPEGTT
ncbi:hypothetical protein [Streptomyces sp. NPDC006879]|uniref:hypothetical protein n=1 Tax=Streptomyces sp. NPDC006879 TaxID=3364767 RepID=UPI0036BDFD84